MAGRKGEKHWRDAVAIAVNEAVEGDEAGRRKLRAIADKLVELAMDGDMQAIKEVGDRMDGKAPQAVDLEANIGVTDPLAELLKSVAGAGKRITDEKG